MAQSAVHGLEPRKTPVQARSTETVEAIFEAAIQVLLAVGSARLTTTRVAARAGVSVGTLYQYYPNKQALLYAVLERHLEGIFAAVEQACRESCSKPLAQMSTALVDAFVTAKLQRTDVSKALYAVHADLDGARLVSRVHQRAERAIVAMLECVPGIQKDTLPFAARMLISTMAGTARHVLEAGASPAAKRDLREHLHLLCGAYLERLAALPWPERAPLTMRNATPKDGV